MLEYDAIIAGASFAGLAVADNLDCDILLIDRKKIGSKQTSACATFTSVLEGLGCKSSILQEFDTLVLHIPEERNVELVEPICTFDYEKFCKTIAKRLKVTALTAQVKGTVGHTVLTDRGNFQSQCIIDCTGWRGVLGSSIKKDYVNKRQLAFGIESVVKFTDENLHFFVDPNIIPRGAAWIFPVGDSSRIGVTSYAGKTCLLAELRGFLKTLGLEPSRMHGGFIPFGLREPVVGDIFMVGDSCGHASATTEEGIRPAINFGMECARIVQNIVNSDKTLEEGLLDYRNIVYKKKRWYNMLLKMQAPLLYNAVPETVKKTACNRVFSKLFQKMYIG
jgi:flavin-dependent dehydrogenase